MMEEKKNIVLVDDHPLVMEGIKGMVTPMSDACVISTFTLAEACIDYLKENNNDIHLVISDISLPGTNGIALCKHIKQHYNHIQVMMLSMHNNREIVREAIDAEADGYMLKHCTAAEMQQAIRRILDYGACYADELLPIITSDRSSLKVKEQAEIELTPRELEILSLILKDFTSEEIASQLFISKKTVDNHRANLLEKTNSRSTVGLVKYAILQRNMGGRVNSE